MGLYKIFKDIFYDTMTSRGFVHQKNVFLRINGEVLQAVTINRSWLTMLRALCFLFLRQKISATISEILISAKSLTGLKCSQ